MRPVFPASPLRPAARWSWTGRGSSRTPTRSACSRSACLHGRAAMPAEPLKIAVVAGEESGDLLGADLVRALRQATGREVRLVGVGGRHLAELGLQSAFDAGEIALIGLSAIIRDLPRLMRRIGQVSDLVAHEKPDCLVTIDSPDFSLRV